MTCLALQGSALDLKPGVVDAEGDRSDLCHVAKGLMQGRPHPVGVRRKDGAALPQHGPQQGLHARQTQKSEIGAQHRDQGRGWRTPERQRVLQPVDMRDICALPPVGAAQAQQQSRGSCTGQRLACTQQVRDAAALRQKLQPQGIGWSRCPDNA